MGSLSGVRDVCVVSSGKSFVIHPSWCPDRDTMELKMSWGGLSTWSCLWVARDAVEAVAEQPETEGGVGRSIFRGNSNRVVPSCMVCVSVSLGMTLAARF